MFIREILAEADQDHQRAYQETGFWGEAAAGCIFFAQNSKRFLIAHRSNLPYPHTVAQPGTWGSWGGAIDRGENPEQAVKREMHEEAGYTGPSELIPLFVFRKADFTYSNFLAVVPNEFTPHLNWENQGYQWCDFGKWPQPLHFGLVSLFNDSDSMTIMQDLVTPPETKAVPT